VQVCWIAATIGGPDGYDANAIAYHQVPAFGAYFVVGCLIGLDARAHRPADPFIIALAAWLMLGGCLAALNPAQAGDQLLGFSGLVLPLACVLVVWVSGRARVPARLRPVAVWLGDITYGSYLLHPVLFFGLTWFVLPGDPLTHAQRWWLAAGVALASCLAAMASERWLESPLRRWGRRWTRDRIGPV
jgi:peptidoglycan/LPS O-acetylase OafA/YrhL